MLIMTEKERERGKGHGGRKGFLSVSLDSTSPAGETIDSGSGHRFHSVLLKEMMLQIRSVHHS